MNLADQYLGSKRFALLKHANLLYYMAGASYRKSEPVINSQALSWCRDKFLHLSQALNLRGSEYSVFRSAVDDFVIADDVIEALSISRILKLREEQVARQFRTKWNLIVQKAKANSDVSTENASYGRFRIEFEALLDEAVRTEKRRRRHTLAIRKIIVATSIVTSLIATFAVHPAVGVASLVLELASVDLLMAAIEHKWGGQELAFFFSRLQASASNEVPKI